MKCFKNFFRYSAQILSFLIFLQSCNVYRSQSISLEQAAQTDQKVRVVARGEKLPFRRIESKNEGFYGYTKERSSTSKKLQKLDIIGREDGKFYRFSLQSLEIDKIQVRNKSTSTLATIGVIVVGLAVIIVSIGLIAWSEGGILSY